MGFFIGLISSFIIGYFITMSARRRSMHAHIRPNEALEVRLHQALTASRGAFPELYKTKIDFVVVKTKDFHMATRYHPFARRQFVYVTRSCRKMPDAALSGCLAHELVHLVQDKRIFFLFLPFVSLIRRFRLAAFERTTDTEAVARGFGKSLIAFSKWANGRYEEYNAEDGLTIPEIKKLMA